MSEYGKIRASRIKSGKRKDQFKYELVAWHRELGQRQVFTGYSTQEVEQKARKKMAQWDEQWEAEEKKRLAVERTQRAQEALSALDHILTDALYANHAVDWESLKDHSDYPTTRPEKPTSPKIDPVSRLVPAFRRKFETRVKEQEEKYAAALAEWEEERAVYLEGRDERNALIEANKEKYLSGDPEAVLDYCDMVLSSSKYPDYFPLFRDLDYNPESKLLIVDYQLPPIDSIPIVREVRYIKTRNEFDEKHISRSELNTRYDSLLYQIPLRTLHELFEADKADALLAVVFNGYVNSIDPATGHKVNPCVLSIQASREEFEQVNLANVDPKACFRNLKGVGSSRLHSLTPIAPILRIEREDARFVSSYAVVDGLQEGDNLAAMDWEDFEHLIRELFEEEFASSGGEVKVTRASRDGGVDAVAFDPDPIRGGKIVIQAKRYTGTVGVSFVRDLYGTVLNEGAIKGILVTTANYGPDAYEFAKDKPLTLLNGSNLLHLLEKHGHKARIDLREAKRVLAEREGG